MGNQSFSRIRDWVEPAHPGLLEHYEDLMAIYTHLRQGWQTKIDATFDAVSRKIGYVVTTTLPAEIEVGAGGVVRSFALSGEHLKGTLFEENFKALMTMREPLSGAPGQKFVRAGTYHIYLIWYDALRLRLRRDWVEPAHLRPGAWLEQIRKLRIEALKKVEVEKHIIVDPDIPEPAHWFDPGTLMEIDDIVIISVLDEVYPDLRLADRVAYSKELIRRIRPEVMEPAHFRPEVMEPAHVPPVVTPKPRRPQPGG
jgi:hypothetical protein